MKAVQMQPGRVFSLTMETGEPIFDTIVKFCEENGIMYGHVSLLGGIGGESKMVTGPELPIGDRTVPIVKQVEGISEAFAFGTIAPYEGKPMIHMHGSVGRDGGSMTGCFRSGVVSWLVIEAVITEFVGSGPYRRRNEDGLMVMDIRD